MIDPAGSKLPEHPIDSFRCGTNYPGWLNGTISNWISISRKKCYKIIIKFEFNFNFTKKMLQVPIPMLLEKRLIGLFVLTLIVSYIWMCKYGIVEDSICIFFQIHHYYLHLVNLDIVQIKGKNIFFLQNNIFVLNTYYGKFIYCSDYKTYIIYFILFLLLFFK